MPITELQRQARKSQLGSSDMAAVMGLDPWRNRSDVYLEKRGLLIDTETDKPIFVAGNRFENAVLDYAEESLQEPIQRNPGAKMVADCPIAVNTDAVTVSTVMPIEAKTVGMLGPSREWWGDEHTDQVPDRVIVQAHCHMLAWEKDLCHVPVFIAGRGFTMFQVNRSAKLAKAIRENATRFWNDHVLAEVPPTDCAPHLEIVKLVRRIPDTQAAVDPQLVQKWLDLQAERKAAEASEDQAKAAVIAALGTAEAGLLGELGAVTYMEQTRKAYLCKESTFRVLRHKAKGL